MRKKFLVDSFPHIVKEWDTTLNPENILPLLTIGDNSKKFMWTDEHNHTWSATVKERAAGYGCPYCSHHQVLEGFNDLATIKPELLPLWSSKNLLNPHQISPNSHKIIIWENPTCHHEWTRPVHRATTECPYCANKILLQGFNDIASNPTSMNLWSTHNNILPTELLVNSHQKIVAECSQCSAIWKTEAIKLQKGCPYCSQSKTLTLGNNTLYDKKPWIISLWSKQNINTPQQILASSRKKKIFLHNKECGHTWETTPQEAIQQCPLCENFNNLLKNTPLYQEIHPTKNTTINVDILLTNYSKKVWWKCEKGHEWEETPRHRTQNTTNCPYCSNHRILEGYNDLTTTAPELLKEWDSVKNTIQPTEIGSGSAQKVWWKCDKGHEWEARVADRTYYKTNCPYCVRSRNSSKPEKELLQYLKKTKLNIIPNDRTVLNGRELDLYIPEKHIAIEYNGLYWHSEAVGKEKDYHYQKWLECKNKGIQLITIWEDDWLRNPTLVKNMLAYKLGVSDTRRVYGRNTRVRSINPSEALLFLNQYHIQGNVAGSMRVGLEDKTTGELVAVMVFKQETPTTLNLLRYSTSMSVIGGFTKLLKHVETTHKPTSIITFSDHMVSDGGLYEKNGFTPVKELPPDYMYIINGKRKHKFGYRLNKFRTDPTLYYKEDLTGHKLALINGLYRVYDAGKTKWEKKSKKSSSKDNM